MPDYKRGNNGGKPSSKLAKLPPKIVEPRCHICQSKFRNAIDRMIALGARYTEIARLFDVDRRGVSRHAKEHLNFEDAAIRSIIEHEAEAAQENIEEGVKGALTRRVYLEVGVQKGLEALLSGDTVVEPKDVVNIITLLDKLDSQTDDTAKEVYQVQFNAFVQAIRELCAPELWAKINDRTRELLSQAPAAIEAPED